MTTSATPAAVGEAGQTHEVSVVVPVFRGEHTLPGLLAEIDALLTPFLTAAGHRVRICEVLLVNDHGPDQSARVIRQLSRRHDYVRPVWLSRNFGQHAATMAGMASSGGDWILTLDEDGQFNPSLVGDFLDVAMADQATVVYAAPTNPAPHGAVRNLLSKAAKRFLDTVLGSRGTSRYHSFRLVLGEVGRSVAAFAGAGVYLDVALGWVAGDVSTCPAELRPGVDRPSGYTLRRLISHFWRMVLTTGTRLLRLVSLIGALTALIGVVIAIVLIVGKFAGSDALQGWTSTMVVTLLTTGVVLFSLGVVAEYLGVAVNMAMGKPPYLLVQDPASGPLGRAPAVTEPLADVPAEREVAEQEVAAGPGG